MKSITLQRQRRIWEVLKNRQSDFRLIMDNIHDPHNVSAIMRSCDAFGIPLIYLYYTDNNFPEIGHKTSGSACKWIYTEKHSGPDTLTRTLIQEGYQIISTGKSETSYSILDLDLTKPTAIVLGNEHKGISPEIKACAHKEVYIPMQGMVESLNVSVAAAIILYEGWRQRIMSGTYQSSSSDPETLEKIFLEWSQK